MAKRKEEREGQGRKIIAKIEYKGAETSYSIG